MSMPRTLLATLLLALLLGTTAAVHAQAGGERKTRVTVAMSQPVYKALTEAQELVEKKEYGAALKVLETLRGKKLSPYEAAQAWNYTAYTHYLQEQYPQAIRAYEQVLAQGELPEAIVTSTLKTLSQLYFTVEQYAKALTTVQRLMAALAEPSQEVYLLLGQAHFQLKQYAEALPAIDRAIAMARAQGNEPQENWLLLKQVIYYERKDYARMVEVVKELLRLYPKESYLRTLAGAYSELGDTRKQLAVMEALYDQGYLTAGRDLVNLANLFLLHEVPVKAARVLERALAAKQVESDVANLRLLSQAWYQAREDAKAIPPLARAAAQAEDGELSVRLAQSYLNLEQWEQAAAALEEGLRKGGLGRTDQAYVMLGMARFNLQRLEQARGAFERALADKRSQKVAGQWLAYVDQELQRRQALGVTE
jgi:tetratricopeptide (TPR) repeat protein